MVRVLKVLQQIFMYDNGEFLDEKTTQDLIPLLIDQLELTSMDKFDEFCDDYLVRNNTSRLFFSVSRWITLLGINLQN